MKDVDVRVRRIYDELKSGERAVTLERLRDLAAHHTLTLLTATRDAQRSEAAVVADVLRG